MTQKKHVRHLQDVHGTYRARLVVPSELRPHIGKTELTEGLGSDWMQARRKLPGAVGRMQDQLNEAREALKAERTPVAPAPRINQPLSVRNLAKAHYESELTIDDHDRQSHGQEGHVANPFWLPAYETMLRNIVSGRFSDEEATVTIGWAIDGFRQRGNTDVADGTPEWRTLARSLAGIQLENMQRSRERDAGNFTGQPVHPLLTPIPVSSDPLKARILSPDSEKPLNELVEQFLAERKPGPQAQHEHRTIIKSFEEFLDGPVPVYAVKRSDIQGFKRALAETPTNFRKLFIGMTLPQAIAANKKRASPHPVLNVRTINDNHLSKLSACLNWCFKNDIIPDNPAAGIKIEAAKATERSREIFTPDDLKLLFGKHFLERDGSKGERQWAMLISLFSGMRPSELAQMKLSSIRTERGVLVFAIEEATKNIGSKRLVPVHSKLIALGLDKYVALLRKAGATHLFPKWFRDGMQAKAQGSETLDQYFPRFIPKRFNTTYRWKVGITDKRKVFYSFRHTFTTGLSLAGVSDDMQRQLIGHVDGSAHAIYVHGTSIEAKRDAIERLTFDGFNL